MRELLEKFQEIEKRLSSQKGDFTLFALVLRDDAPDKWDLLVAAPWLERNSPESLSLIVKEVQSTLTPEQITTLSRVVLLDETNPALKAINQAFSISHSRVEIRDSNMFGLQIKHAYIFSSTAPASQNKVHSK